MKNKWAQSSDGSLSAYNAQFDECYHSLKDGALSETLHKHIYPAVHCLKDSDTLKGFSAYKYIKIHALDICFGLGYNTFSLLSYLIQNGYSGSIEIYSPEKDEDIFENLLEFNYPEFIFQSLPQLKEILQGFVRAKYGTLSTYHTQVHQGKQNLEFAIHLYKGEALTFLETLARNVSRKFEVIAQDPFSPSKNPELWSKEYFMLLGTLLCTQGIITTYSRSKIVYQNAIESGLKVYSYESGVVRGGSIFAWSDPIFTQQLRVLQPSYSLIRIDTQ